jgi:hypothetical protein
MFIRVPDNIGSDESYQLRERSNGAQDAGLGKLPASTFECLMEKLGELEGSPQFSEIGWTPFQLHLEMHLHVPGIRAVRKNLQILVPNFVFRCCDPELLQLRNSSSSIYKIAMSSTWADALPRPIPLNCIN